MKDVTKLMINEFKIKQLGFDFMGYSLRKGENYTFHHLIVPKRDGGKMSRNNGAILCGKSSHPYLHIIEAKDYDIFDYITQKMIGENIKGYLDIHDIRKIHEVLKIFEREHSGDITKKGHPLIKEEYTRRKKL